LKPEKVRMTVSLPVDATEFLDREAEKDCTSRNAQIVRSIRERMEKVTAGEALVGEAPPSLNETTALASGVPNHHG